MKVSKKQVKTGVIVAIALVACLVLGLIGGSRLTRGTSSYMYDAGGITNSFSGMYTDSVSGMGGSKYDSVEVAPPLSDMGAELESSLDSDRKLIRTATVRVETTEYDAYSVWLTGALREVGGYMSYTDSQSLSNSRGEYRTLNCEMRVPVENYDVILNQLGDRGDVRSRSENVSDVTGSYQDTEQHLASIRIEQTRLQELLAMAETVDEILQIEDRLTYVRYEIESYQHQLDSYDDRIEFCTISLTLTEVLEYTEPEPEGFFARCVSGLKENAKAVAEFFTNATVWVVSHIPALLVLAVIGIAVRIVVVRRRRKRKSSDEPAGGDENS